MKGYKLFTRAWGVVLVGATVGCGPVGPGQPQADTGGGSSGEVVPTTGGGSASGTVGTTGAPGTTGSGGGTSGVVSGGSSGAESGGTDGLTFIMPMDAIIDGRCDPFAQDCPPGMKCSAYAEGGGSSWNATKCVPVMENPVGVGEACFVEGNGVSGIDNCELGAYCWDVDKNNMGTCVALCTGSPEAPMCEPGFVCPIYSDGVLNLCLPACDPLMQECEEGDVCIGNNNNFLCVLDASGDGGQVHDPCEYANACDPGLVCLNASAAEECDQNASGCCEPYCDVTLPNMCPGVGQECLPWFEPGEAPEGYEKVGVCAVPM